MGFPYLQNPCPRKPSFRKSHRRKPCFRIPNFSRVRRPLKTTFDMTTLIFSTGGCPSYPFYSFKRGPWYPVFRENPSREVATKDHLSSNHPKGNPLDLKTKVDVNKVDVKGFPIEFRHPLTGKRELSTTTVAPKFWPILRRLW